MSDEFDDRSREDEAPEEEAADEQAPAEERPEAQLEDEVEASAAVADLEEPAEEAAEEDEAAEADTDIDEDVEDIEEEGETGEEETEESEEEEAEEHEPGAFLRPDGLDSGLSWFGAEPFIPPRPPGATPPARPVEEAEEEVAFEGAEAAAAALSASERRQQVRDRLHARRAEKRADRSWYQLIPIPVYFTLPIIIFTVCYVLIVAPPWEAIPGPKGPLDSALLKAEAVDDQAARLEEMGMEVRPDDVWRLLPGGELIMAEGRRRAAVFIEPEEPLKDCEVSVEVCLIGPAVGATVWLRLNEGTGTALGLARMNRQKHLVRKHGFNRYRSEMEFHIKPNAWYTLALRVEGKRTRYYLNGRELSPVASRPAEVNRVVLVAEEARAAFRNWRIQPLK